MDVNSTGASNGVQHIPRHHQGNQVSTTERNTGVFRPVSDELEISDVGRMLSDLHETDGPAETRQQKLQRIKAEIENGTYDTEEKMDAALMRLLGEIEPDGD